MPVSDPRAFTPTQRSVLEEVLAHDPATAAEATHVRRVARAAAAAPAPMDRTRRAGHVVASGLVADPDGEGVLLARHRQLGKWLHFGGHAEPGETHPLEVARREVREESGLDGLAAADPADPLVDVDVHVIPATGEMPAHEHLDLRYLLTADPDAPLDPADEELEAVRWFGWEGARERVDEPGLLRLLGKAREALE